MIRITLVSLVVGALVAVGLAVTASARTTMSHPKLVGVTGKNDAFVITLKTTSGKRVKTLKRGTYTFVIHDDSSLHSYNLDGPNHLEKVFTSVPFIGTKKFTLKLKAGKYKAYCKVHESQMFQHFVVK